MGAIAWHAIADPKAQIDADTWRAMERALGEDGLAAKSAHPALAATSTLVRKMLAQTGRNHVARASDARTLCALETPTRLWRALGEAGPCPQPAAGLDLSERWWLVEVEAPADAEPNAIALWEENGAEVALAAFLGVDDGSGGSCLTVVTWRTAPDGERSAAGLAALRCPVHADDPHNPVSRAGTQLVIETLAAPQTGPIARAKTAIALHLASDGRAAPLASYRPSTAGARARGEEAPAGQRSITALFALERAPEPEPAEERATGEGHLRGGRATERTPPSAGAPEAASVRAEALAAAMDRRRGLRARACAERRPDCRDAACTSAAPRGSQHGQTPLSPPQIRHHDRRPGSGASCATRPPHVLPANGGNESGYFFPLVP